MSYNILHMSHIVNMSCCLSDLCFWFLAACQFYVIILLTLVSALTNEQLVRRFFLVSHDCCLKSFLFNRFLVFSNPWGISMYLKIKEKLGQSIITSVNHCSTFNYQCSLKFRKNMDRVLQHLEQLLNFLYYTLFNLLWICKL